MAAFETKAANWRRNVRHWSIRAKVSEKTQVVLAGGTDNPLKDVTYSGTLRLLWCNPDVRSSKMAGDLLRTFGLRRPRRLIYQKDALLAATFVPGGSNNSLRCEGDGQLLCWKANARYHPRHQYLRSRHRTILSNRATGFASFSPDGRWLLVSSNAHRLPTDRAPHRCASTGAPPTPSTGREPCKVRSGDGRCRIKHASHGRDLRSAAKVPCLPVNQSDRLSLMCAAQTRPNGLFQVEALRELVDRSGDLRTRKSWRLPSPHP